MKAAITTRTREPWVSFRKKKREKTKVTPSRPLPGPSMVKTIVIMTTMMTMMTTMMMMAIRAEPPAFARQE